MVIRHEHLVCVEIWRNGVGNGPMVAHPVGLFVSIAKHILCILEALFQSHLWIFTQAGRMDFSLRGKSQNVLKLKTDFSIIQT